MWLSERAAKSGERQSAGADIGAVTIGGDNLAVLTEGELRELALVSPGGYIWRPQAGDSVLVLKSGDGESLAIGAVTGQSPPGMENGEVYIMSKAGTGLRLKNNGKIELLGDLEMGGEININGNVNITGSLKINGQDYSPCQCS
ncbi:MAG TPA: hypothetical protein GXZ52_00615 [Clostridiales bacterium]|nr:hypothetical protein [Clostridiales bacterium]